MPDDIVAIDPGQTGAVAWNADGTLYVEHLQNDPQAFVDQIRRIGVSDSKVYVEDVGYGRPGTNVKSVTTFSRHCGMLVGATTAMGLQTTYVRPQVWMRREFPDRPTGDDAVTLRKLYILEECERWVVDIGLELHEDSILDINTADSVGILKYGLGL
jgi:hypothetical protein